MSDANPVIFLDANVSSMPECLHKKAGLCSLEQSLAHHLDQPSSTGVVFTAPRLAWLRNIAWPAQRPPGRTPPLLRQAGSGSYVALGSGSYA